jgi:hypothetical protein
MKKALIMLVAAVLPLTGFSQTATNAESQAALQIAQCMAEGPPDDWQQLYMVIELPEAGAPAGRVRYLAARESTPDLVPYTPCDPQKPAKILMDSRATQTPERQRWTGARLVIHRSGRFDLNYDYPK